MSLPSGPDQATVALIRGQVRRAVEALGAIGIMSPQGSIWDTYHELLWSVFGRLFRRLAQVHGKYEAEWFPPHVSWPTDLPDPWLEEFRTLGSEELGCAYESLLDLRPKFVDQSEKFRLEHCEQERKATGSFYTARHLIELILDLTLAPALRECRSAEAVLRLRVCDPACGTGHFLWGAARRMVKRVNELRYTEGDPQAWVDVVSQCIFGVDIDPVAAELCRATLWLEAGGEPAVALALRQHVRCFNSLIGDAVPDSPARFSHWHREFPQIFPSPLNSGFDVVLGNPPHGAGLSKSERRKVNKELEFGRTAGNSAADFLNLGLAVCRPQGRVGFIVPKSLTYSRAWRGVRQSLLGNLAEVVDLGRAWDEVLLEQIAITYRPGGNSEPVRLGRRIEARTAWNPPLRRDEIALLDIYPTGMTADDQELWHLVRQQAAGTLGEWCHTVRGAALQKFIRQCGTTRVISGRDLEEFRKPTPCRFLTVPSQFTAKIRWTQPPQVAFQNIIAHVRKPTDHIRLIGTVVRQRFAVLDTVNLIHIQEPRCSPEALCGLLLSDLVNWWVYVVIYNRAIRTMHFDNYFLSRVPTPAADQLTPLHEASVWLEQQPDELVRWERLNNVIYDLFRVPGRFREMLAASHGTRSQSPQEIS